MLTFITGAGRSGTTLTARIFEACGGNLGDSSGLAEHNGFKRLIKGLLKDNYLDPLGQHPLGDPETLTYPDDWYERAEKVRDADVIKEAKFLLTWPVWVENYPDVNWVIVRRNRDRIAESCERTYFMKLAPDWYAWADFYIAQIDRLKEHCKHYAEVWPQDALDGEYGDMRTAVQFCGLTWNQEAVERIIRPDRWHS